MSKQRKPSSTKATERRARRRAPAARRAFRVVGVGASAGGLDAMQRMLAAIAPSTQLAIVYVQHMDARREHQLVPLLAARTGLTVVAATEGARVAAGRVYVIPPHTDVSLAAGRLRLQPLTGEAGPPRTVDAWFRSLAADRQRDAIGVVLSGSGDDGAQGARAIHAAGGIVLAQAPQSARFDGMPASAIATGAVDAVLTPEEIGAELERLAGAAGRRRPGVPGAADAEAGVEPTVADPLDTILDLLRTATGVDFAGYKRPMVRRRILRRMGLRNLPDLDALAQCLRDEPDALAQLCQDLLIPVTSFVRDPQVFRVLERRVLPKLVAAADPDAPFRVWVPGCSTGEEAYSVAMCVLDAIGQRPLQLFGTDLQQPAIDAAREGIYSAAALKPLGAARRARFFRKLDDGRFVVQRRLRDVCVFARHDLLRDPPFSRLDLVSCRNLLIYLQPTSQRQVIRLLHYALRPGGCLMLGAAESAGAAGLFEPFDDKRRKIYRRCDTGLRPPGEPLLAGAVEGYDTRRRSAGSPAPPPGATGLPQEVDRIIRERFAPPSVLVDDRLDVVQFHGDTSRHLQHRAGRASLSLLKMVRPELALEVRTALSEARARGEPASSACARWRRPDGEWDSTVEAVPIRAAGGQESGFLVLFHDRPITAEQPARKAARALRGSRRPPTPADDRVAQLELDLDESRNQLRVTAEEHEAFHEELRAAMEEVTSTNEELQSINEELETAKEELQSANEELQSINDEMQMRNAELTQVNIDLQNLLRSVDIPIFMLGKRLEIRRFTASVEPLFHVIPTDVGRPIVDLRSNLDVPELERILGEVIASKAPAQREVRDRTGTIYSMWTRPYLTANDDCEGVVMSFFDITERKRAENALQLYADRLRLLGEIDGAVLAGRSLAAVARLALPRIRQFLAAAHAGVVLMDAKRTEASILVQDPAPGAAAAITHEVFRDDTDELPLTTTDDVCLPDLAAVAARAPSLARFANDGMRSLLSVPLVVEGRLIGRLFAAARPPHAFDQGHVGLARDVANHLAVAIEQARLYEQVSAARERLAVLAANLVTAQEAERRRLAKELHDEIGQALTGLKLSLVAIGAESPATRVAASIAQVDRLLATVRSMSLDLRPAVLDDLGLLPALLTHNESLEARTGLRVHLEHQGIDRRLPSDVETAAYRIVQEALTNVVRHAGVLDATVRVWGDVERLTIQVTDEGAGFDPARLGSGSSSGLSGMIERAAAIGGEVTIEAAPGHGTRLLAVLPLAAAAQRVAP